MTARHLVATLLALSLATACGPGDRSAGTERWEPGGAEGPSWPPPGPSGGTSVGGPGEVSTPAEVLRMPHGSLVRVRGDLVVWTGSDGTVIEARLCSTLVVGDRPRCDDGVPLSGLDLSVLAPGTESAQTREGAVRWVERFELIAKTTPDGLEVVGDTAG